MSGRQPLWPLTPHCIEAVSCCSRCSKGDADDEKGAEEEWGGWQKEAAPWEAAREEADPGDKEAAPWEEDWWADPGDKEAGAWEEDWWSDPGDKAAPEWEEDWMSDPGGVRSSFSDGGLTSTTLEWSSAPSSSRGPWLSEGGQPVAVDFLQKPLQGLQEEAACSKCGTIMEPLEKGVRLMKKSPPMYMCRVCNNRTSSLSNMFGGWPIEAYRHLSEADQKQFWIDVGAAFGPDGIKRVVETSIFVKEVQRSINLSAGEYQPISFWERLGYDGVYIRRNCASEWNSDLGSYCYRVRIHKESREFIRDRARQLMLSTLKKEGSAPSKRQRASDEPEVEPEVEKKEEAEPSTQDSSTTTTSSSSSPAPKKDKKDKKDKKNKDKEDPKKAT